MKYIIISFFVIGPLFGMAQQTGDIKINYDSLSKNTINDLLDTWTLGIDSNSESIDIRMYNKFKNLFDSDAMVEDDITVLYKPGTYMQGGVYFTDTVARTFDMYAHDVTLKVKGLNIDTAWILNSNTANPAQVTYKLKRNVEVQMTREFLLGDSMDFVVKSIGDRFILFERASDNLVMKRNFLAKVNNGKDAVYRFSSVAELQVTMRYDNEGVYKITSIENITPRFLVACRNDDDKDVVLNADDSLPQQPGDFTASGMPDFDFDGVTDVAKGSDGFFTTVLVDKCKTTYGILSNLGCPASYFSSKILGDVFVGFQVNSTTINLPELNQLGYLDEAGNDAVDVLQSKKGMLNNPGSITGISAGGNVIFYIGKKRKMGVSVGAVFSRYTANYTLTDPIVYTYKSFDGGDFYRRQLTIRSLQEKITYYMLNFPILFNYRVHLGNRNLSSANFKIGPSVVIFKNTSDYDALINVGGIYQVNPARQAIVYDNYLDPASPNNVYITSQGINSQNTSPGAISVFSQLQKSYDFTDDKNYRDKSRNLNRYAIAVNAGFDLHRKITESFAFRGGLYFTYAALPAKTKKYIPLDRTTEPYNSIFNSTAKSVYSTFGISAGMVYNFF